MPKQQNPLPAASPPVVKQTDGSGEAASKPAWLAVTLEKVKSVQNGWVQVVVHDGKVVQIETVDRTRFDDLNQKAKP